MRAPRMLAIALIAGTAAFTLAGCSTEARAERKGKQFGDEVCKIKSADNANAADRHLRKAQDKADDLRRFVGRDVGEDVRGATRNLQQLVRDVSAGRSVREQDVNAIARSVESAVSDSTGAAKAAYDGILEGLNNCN